MLGLRALYFALAEAMTQFAYLGAGLGLVLVFIGAKMLLALAGTHVPVEATLVVVVGTVGAAVVASVCRGRGEAKASVARDDGMQPRRRQQGDDGVFLV